MTALLFATYLEAKPLLEILGAKNKQAHKPKSNPPFYFEFPDKDLLICISGMGFKAAALAINELLTKYKPARVINVGICGALAKAAEVGNIYQVNKSIVWPDTEKSYASTTLLPVEQFAQVTLVSSKKPVFDRKTKEQLNKHADIVDMEGALFAKKCSEHNIPCSFIKGVSDLADDGNNKVLMQNIERVSKLLAQTILPLIGGHG